MAPSKKYKGKHWKPELHRSLDSGDADPPAVAGKGSWGWRDDDGWYERPAAANTNATAVWSAATPGTGARPPRPADGGGADPDASTASADHEGRWGLPARRW